MGAVLQLPGRDGFSDQECSRIIAVAASAGVSVVWIKTECGSLWACFRSADDTLGSMTREKGMVLWFPRDSLAPFLAHISLEECLARVRGLL